MDVNAAANGFSAHVSAIYAAIRLLKTCPAETCDSVDLTAPALTRGLEPAEVALVETAEMSSSRARGPFRGSHFIHVRRVTRTSMVCNIDTGTRAFAPWERADTAQLEFRA